MQLKPENQTDRKLRLFYTAKKPQKRADTEIASIIYKDVKAKGVACRPKV